MKEKKIYTKKEVMAASLEYFNGDELAASTFINKYALKNKEGEYLEKTPDDMHDRLAKEFNRIENKYKNPKKEEDFKNSLDHFKYIVPGGSVMYGVGNPYVNVSLSNCIALSSPSDSISGIFDKSKDMANLFKARCGIGLPLDNLRPDGSRVNNSAGSSTGAWSFANYYSEVCRMIGQCLHKDTFILTKRGLVKIKDINIGDKVWSQNGWVNVVNKIKNKKHLFKITTRFGKEILCSDDHVFHTINGEKKTKDFSIGDPITQIVGEGWKGQDILLENFENKLSTYNNSNQLNTNLKLPYIVDEKLAYLLGQIYGNGSVEKNEISISTDNDWKEIINKITAYIKNIFDYNAKITRGSGDFSKIRIHSKLIIHHLQKNKLLKNSSIKMKFPEKLLLSKPNVVFAFLSGYFDAGGCVLKGKKVYKLDSINKDFLIIVQNILSSFGIVSKLHIQNREKLGWLDLYTLTINGEKSQRLFTKYMKESIKIQSTKEGIGNFSKIKDFVKTAYQINDFNSKNSTHSYASEGEKQKYISYSTSYRLLDDLKLEKKITLLQDSIKSIEDLGYEDETYDLVLDKEHLFFANGLYAHNSGRRGALILTMNVKHPDIEKFVTMKRDLTKVTGANVSVMITDEFMEAVKNNEEWKLQWPIDVPVDEAKYTKTIMAKDLWHLINESATKSGEPGLIFIDNYKKNLPADYYPEFKSVCVNPCCFSQEHDVFVITKNGYKEIKEINNQDKIWLNGEYVETTGYFDAGEAFVYKVKFSCPDSDIYITENHKLLKVNTEEKTEVLTELKDLSIGDSVRFVERLSDSQFAKIDYMIEEIELVGNHRVGCIEVPKHHMFTLKNGMISGNSEILLSEYDSCRLTSINLKSFVINPFTNKAYFDFEKFEEIVRLAMRTLDNIIDLEIECLTNMVNKFTDESEVKLWSKLIDAASKGRRTGLGTHGFADALSCLCLKYDTKEAQEKANEIYSSLRNFAYDESCNLAIERGPFSCFDWEVEKECDFIKRLPQELQEKIKTYGRRNISLLTNAPTGSISIVSQTSSGIEPVFMNFYTRRKKISGDSEKVDFVDDSGDKWSEYPVFHHNIMEYINMNQEIAEKWEDIKINKKPSEWSDEIAKLLPEYFISAMEIDAYERVKIQGIIQSNICHGISSTINLPKGTTVEQVQDIYQSAWENKLKGVTVYVDGSRAGVLISQKDDSKIQTASAPKRPVELPCEIHHSTIDGEKWTIFVGLLDGKPYEIFGGLSKYVTIPKKYKTGKIIKTKNGKKNVNGRYAFYNLVIDDGDGDPLEVQNIAVTFDNASYAAQTRMISLALRHGVPVQYISEQLGRDESSEFFSFSKVMARVLKKFVEDGSESSDVCDKCGAKLVFESGCRICKSCGKSTKCD